MTHGELRRASAAIARGLKLQPADHGLRRIRLRIVGIRIKEYLRSTSRRIENAIKWIVDRIKSIKRPISLRRS